MARHSPAGPSATGTPRPSGTVHLSHLVPSLAGTRRGSGSSAGATGQRKAPPASLPSPTATGGSRAPHPQPARPGHAAHPSCASRPGQPVRSFPNIFCIHLVNKFYILLISSADGLSTRRGGGGRLPVPALQPLRATRCVRSAPARPASDEEIFLFWWLFHHIDVANRLRSSPAPLLT